MSKTEIKQDPTVMLQSQVASNWLGLEEPLVWQCKDIKSEACLNEYVAQWWAHASRLAPSYEGPPIQARAWFFKDERAWVDLDALPAVSLQIEARWLLSFLLGLNQWLDHPWQWTVLEKGQPRSSFSNSIVLPSVMDHDFMEAVMKLVDRKEVQP